MDYEKIAEGVEVPPVETDEAASLRLLKELNGGGGGTEKVLRVSDAKFQGLGAEKGYNQDYARIKKTRYSHEALIDVIISEPTIKQNDLAARFEVSPPWISRVIGSDAFQAALAKRREELTNPFLIATIEERLKGVVSQSLDVIAEKLQSSQSADLALKALDLGTKALGFGARNLTGGNIQNNFVVQMPLKAVSSGSWAAEHQPVIEG